MLKICIPYNNCSFEWIMTWINKKKINNQKKIHRLGTHIYIIILLQHVSRYIFPSFLRTVYVSLVIVCVSDAVFGGGEKGTVIQSLAVGRIFMLPSVGSASGPARGRCDSIQHNVVVFC